MLAMGESPTLEQVDARGNRPSRGGHNRTMSFEPVACLDMATPSAKAGAYGQLLAMTQSLLAGERDRVANLAQFSALVWSAVPELNWAGFYLVDPTRVRELVVGPFQGKPACVRIPFDKGVCGACARSGQVQLVEDVQAFPGHIACDAASRSELVLPVVVQGRLAAVFDLDSPRPARFDAADAEGLARAVEALVEATDWSA
jgi:L-methionine (R)-S-oxide reductase